MSFGAVEGDAGVAAFVLGKLPAHGDFISRGLDDEAIEAADAAVAEAITLAALRWDYRWDDVYVETPVWRFVAAPGVVGRDWVAGVFMASVDAVGRQFPLMAGFNAQTLALVAHAGGLTAALDEAERLARMALLEAQSVDTLLLALEEAVRHFAPPASDDPGAAFAQSALRRVEGVNWSADAVFWVAGARGIEPVHMSGPLAGETLSGLFLSMPQEAAPAPVEDLPPAEEAAEAGLDVAALEDSPAPKAVVSSVDPADAA